MCASAHACTNAAMSTTHVCECSGAHVGADTHISTLRTCAIKSAHLHSPVAPPPFRLRRERRDLVLTSLSRAGSFAVSEKTWMECCNMLHAFSGLVGWIKVLTLTFGCHAGILFPQMHIVISMVECLLKTFNSACRIATRVLYSIGRKLQGRASQARQGQKT